MIPLEAWLMMVAVLVMLAAALAVVVLPNLLAAVAASAVVSLALSLVLVLLRAPDVALTEAVVGAGLSGVLLAIAVGKLSRPPPGVPGASERHPRREERS